MKYLGVDFGSKRIGLATSSEDGKIAFPLKILKNDKGFWSELSEVIALEKVEALVVGESVNNNGSHNEIQSEIDTFKNAFSTKFNLPVFFQKEFMTSVFSRGQGLGKANIKGRNTNHKQKNKKEGRVDASAAALILQRFLDKQK